MENPDQRWQHLPVLSAELIQGLNIREGGQYLDATVGGGGHSVFILAEDPTLTLMAVDRDAQALVAAQAHLRPYGDRAQFWRGNFAEFDPGDLQFDGIIADLGLSSPQLDRPERGFSFRSDAPLDMRMDQSQSLTAAELVNTASEVELADIFYRYGEERWSRRIARHLVENRPYQTTMELAAAVVSAQPRSASSRLRRRIHPATRVFQALRIAVNQELVSLETFLQRSPAWLRPGSRIGIISFHSLEDRIVKHQFRDNPVLQVITKKPICPQPQEIATNPRARSAKLRLAEKVLRIPEA
jgi:16S rRNA (cytosine1402-N4)-methyltransferase